MPVGEFGQFRRLRCLASQLIPVAHTRPELVSISNIAAPDIRHEQIFTEISRY